MPGPQGNQEGGELSSISEWLGGKHQGQARRAAIFNLETAGGGILVTGRLLLVAVAATLKQHKEGEAWNVGSSSGWTAPQTTLYFCICDLLGICICTCLPPLSIWSLEIPGSLEFRSALWTSGLHINPVVAIAMVCSNHYCQSEVWNLLMPALSIRSMKSKHGIL